MKTYIEKVRSHSERGQSLTELALMLPFLVLLIVGTLDLSRAYEVYVDVTNAAREGARLAAVSSTTTTLQDRVTARVNQELNSAGIGPVTVAAPACTSYTSGSAIDCGSAVTGDYITVGVSIPFQFVSFSVIGLGNITVSNSATMAVVLP